MYLISDTTVLRSNAHFVSRVFSESSLQIFEHMGHSYGNLISPSVSPNVCASSGFVFCLADWFSLLCFLRWESHVVQGGLKGAVYLLVFLVSLLKYWD